MAGWCLTDAGVSGVRGLRQPWRRQLFVSGAALVLVAAGCSNGDGGDAGPTSPAVPTTPSLITPPTSVAGGPPDDAAFAAWFESRPGTAEARCVDVDELRQQPAWVQLADVDGSPMTNPDGSPVLVLDVRSGDIVGGNFSDLSGEGSPGDPDFKMKVYWVPEDSDLASREPLTVTVTDLHGPSVDTTSTFKGASQVRADGVTRYFWPSGVGLPESGRWRITAQASGVWGCFEVTI